MAMLPKDLAYWGFLPFGRVHLMSHSTYVVINYLAQSFCYCEWPMCRQGIPRCKRKVFTKFVLSRSIENLLGIRIVATG